jgi:hypothetical protein
MKPDQYQHKIIVRTYQSYFDHKQLLGDIARWCNLHIGELMVSWRLQSASGLLHFRHSNLSAGGRTLKTGTVSEYHHYVMFIDEHDAMMFKLAWSERCV